MFQSTLIYKPPIAAEPTNVVPWHFDRHYWSTSASDKMLTAFIPFHDCGEQMGTITMVDGSHRWREIGRTTGDQALRRAGSVGAGALLPGQRGHNGDEISKTPMIIRKGHMSFHHCRAYHGSGSESLRSAAPRHLAAPARR